MAKPKITEIEFGIQSGTTNTLYAKWTWTKSNTESYYVKWEYCAGGVWFTGSSSSNSVNTTDPSAAKQSTYNIPGNASAVRFAVKPISKKKNNGNGKSYWSADWSTAITYDVTQTPPITPSIPNPDLDEYKLTAILENLTLNADSIHFQILVRDGTQFKQFAISDTAIQYADENDKKDRKNGYARYACNLQADGEYKVRARSSRDGINSDWSDYSTSVYTPPVAPTSITTIKTLSETSVYLEWPVVNTATTYEVEYATELRYFDITNMTTTTSGIQYNKCEIGGLETGDEYFFRVRAVAQGGTSKWSSISSIAVGKKPAAPTTWSSTTTVIKGEPLKLYWVHNSEDGSSQTYAHLEVLAGDDKIIDKAIQNSTEEDEKDKTSVYEIDTSIFDEGAVLKWRVKTKGVTSEYGDWSIQRTIDVYAPPTVGLSLTDDNANALDIVTSFPLYVRAVAGPSTQAPIGYHVSIVAKESYETTDNVGNDISVSAGDTVYSQYFDTTENPLILELSPSSVTFENNISYTLTCVSSMNSGLSGEASVSFKIAWGDDEFWPNAEIGIDREAYTATITPYCEDENENLVEGVTLSVYRRDYDGHFTEIMSGVPNNRITQVTDPHPALDFARYRIVAKSETTGSVNYYDVPGEEVGGKAVILQWDEVWSNFDTPDTAFQVEPSWSGSMLRLPYNIDVSDSFKPDVSLVKYIGRDHPTSYYGTQLGVSSSWNMDIEKDDEETLYALRRLSRWMGDVYVREPSGSGYWANVVVSFSQKHRDVTIPVTLTITRVEGGI